jgi:mannose-6-phosphate isomerase-like protein (cupin superfamily)
VKRHPALVPLSHDHHHTLVRARELRRAAADADDDGLAEAAARFCRAFAGEVTRHFRDEEELLFPLLDPVVDLLARDGEGPLWGSASDDLNATLLAWPAGAGTPEHVNEERDVVVVGVAGSGTLTIDGEAHPIGAGTAAVVGKGRRRRIEAGPAGLRYLTVHRLRGGLSVTRRTTR